MENYIRFDKKSGRTVGAPRNTPGDGEEWYRFKIIGRRNGAAQYLTWSILDDGLLLGEWVAKDDPLDKPVSSKAVNEWRCNEEKKPIEVDGVLYDFDAVSRERMRVCVQCWYDIEKHGPKEIFEGKKIIWLSSDNKEVRMSYAELRDLELELTRLHALRMANLHVRSRVLKRGAKLRDLV